MNSNINCPQCNEIIENEEFDFRSRNRVAWYKFKKSEMYCPHCGVKLKYETKAQVLIFIIGIMIVFSIALAVLGLVPVYSIVFLPFLLLVMFFRTRKLCVKKNITRCLNLFSVFAGCEKRLATHS